MPPEKPPCDGDSQEKSAACSERPFIPKKEFYNRGPHLANLATIVEEGFDL
jgi:hypothetical protein